MRITITIPDRIWSQVENTSQAVWEAVHTDQADRLSASDRRRLLRRSQIALDHLLSAVYAAQDREADDHAHAQ